MSSEESPAARQKSEFTALRAIYGKDIKDLRKKPAWNNWSPLDLAVTLTPQIGSSGNQEVYVQVDLHVICPEEYPIKAPKVLLENGKGMSQTILLKLTEELQLQAKELEGTEMIYELCQHIREKLHQHNKPAMKSLYHEMLLTQEEKKREQELQKQLEEDRNKETMMKEVKERQEMLKSEARLRRERQRSTSENEADGELQRKFSLTNRKRHNSSTESSDEFVCNHRGVVCLDFNGREIQRGQCIRHIEPNNVIFVGIDTETGELTEISQWRLEIKNNDTTQLLKILSNVEQELNYYVTKLKHTNLSHYLGFKHEIVENQVYVYILKEFISGSNCCSLFTSPNIKVEINFLKHLAKGVLTAIDYLHRNNVVHKNIGDFCVFVSEKGVIKVSDYSIHRRMLDLLSPVHVYYSKKGDIFDFGKFILALLGQNIANDNVEIPNLIQSDLYDFLTRCLNKDEKSRYTANQLLNHPFFHKTIVHFSPQQALQDLPLERNVSPEITHNLSASSTGNSQSRIDNEFEILEHLGKGAFGDVLKARNKLDGGYYAIKRIRLNPKNKVLSKKIVREVTLLSRLNHENVVRYYNSWIETTTVKGDAEENSSFSATTTETDQRMPKVVRKDDFTLNDDIERLAPPMKNVEISITYDSKSQAPYDESSSSDDDDEDDDDDSSNDAYSKSPVIKFSTTNSDSDSIEFDRGSDAESSKTSESKTASLSKSTAGPVNDSSQDILLQLDYLYIQMEFCEKSTLRTAIDRDLYLDQDRVWRLFREIVEGLAHIHQQGMIHRDLKPVNIFLDYSDHVKIGDFGLATTIRIAMRSRQGEYFGVTKSQAESLKEDMPDESKTGHIGTALYIAPEINSSGKANYNQKVDIYSLGIILFEMCYKPLDTGMERIKILNKLRMKDVGFPSDFDDNDRARFLIKWLLNHDISNRPTSQELLQSEYLPPPVLEERELQELVRHTLSNPQLKGYRYLISSCFKQTITLAQDITYDRDPTAPSLSKPLNLYEFVRDVCIKIFKQHGGQNLATPLLMPKSKYYEEIESCVKLMTHFGNIVLLPHDLRVPFARYIAWNNINLLRRYAVERVYKEKKVFGFLPREFYECAFDIVSPTKGYLMSDAEILYIVYEIIKELPGIANMHFVIKLNHTGLLKAILLYCGLKEKQEELFKLLLDIKEGKVPKLQIHTFLQQRGLSDNMIHVLVNLLYSEYEMDKVVNQFQMIIKKKSSEASNLAKEALAELRTIVDNAELYGIDFDFVVAPGLVYNVQQYSGMICQFVCELKKKRKHDNKEVVAIGGRYDAMIAYYRNIMEQTNMITKDVQQSAVGISISLDKLVQAIQKEDSEELPKVTTLDTVVCSVGSNHLLKEKIKMLKCLWRHGIKSSLIEETNSVEVQEQLMKIGVPHAFIFKDNDQVRVKSWDVSSKDSFDKFQEKTYNTLDLQDNFSKLFRSRSDSIVEGTQTSNILSRSESKNSYTDKNDSEPVVDIVLVISGKASSTAKRRYDMQTRTQLDGLFKKLCGFITVVGITAESNIVRTLNSYLDFKSEDVFFRAAEECISKHQKERQYINEICDEIWNVKMRKTNPTIVLFSLKDNFYKVLV
ncbi:eIF-2-alpha kinase GCN2 [Sitophilus oryzae]|uniref:non-specific serine/threonine protein kinase n=1 Tax=Sitophilus oryzae TaxID=7048 RepID=A0A6J2YNT3_SITOR|nr:eIF-2-alpha kinase GCN2 [Sitophilus oryzae]XP_030764957.1 eIF-2-alpha kinase GCN2 [Sitophilus oryzae]XP_030764958.1 eIF-2-alpha kinase GCN2 [Sitophilus oryzae]